MTDPTRPVVPDVVEEHFEELSFLLVQRRKLLFHPDAGPRALADHDERIAAHLDGLLAAGEAGCSLALRKLEEGMPFEKASAVLTLVSVFPLPPETFQTFMDIAGPEGAPSFREGLRLSPPAAVDRVLPAEFQGSIVPPALVLATDAWGWHQRLHPNRLAVLSAHLDASVRAAAFRIIGLSPGAASTASRGLSDRDPEVRRRALWALALADPGAAVSAARRGALGPSPDPFAVRLLGLLGGPEELSILLRVPGTAGAAAAHALGDTGDPRAVPALLERARGGDEEIAAAARDAVERITGAAPGEDGAKWWAALRERFPEGRRFLRGRPWPHEGDPQEESLESLWVSAIRTGKGEPWRRRDVPDGFFTGLPCEEALLGE